MSFRRVLGLTWVGPVEKLSRFGVIRYLHKIFDFCTLYAFTRRFLCLKNESISLLSILPTLAQILHLIIYLPIYLLINQLPCMLTYILLTYSIVFLHVCRLIFLLACLFLCVLICSLLCSSFHLQKCHYTWCLLHIHFYMYLYVCLYVYFYIY